MQEEVTSPSYRKQKYAWVHVSQYSETEGFPVWWLLFSLWRNKPSTQKWGERWRGLILRRVEKECNSHYGEWTDDFSREIWDCLAMLKIEQNDVCNLALKYSMISRLTHNRHHGNPKPYMPTLQRTSTCWTPEFMTSNLWSSLRKALLPNPSLSFLNFSFFYTCKFTFAIYLHCFFQKKNLIWQ